MPYRYSRFLPAYNFLCDLLLLNLALRGPIFFGLAKPIWGSEWFVILLANLGWIVLSTMYESYHIARPLILKASLIAFLRVIGRHFLVMLVVAYSLNRHPLPFGELLIIYILFTLSVGVHRFLLSQFLNYIRKKGYNGRHILVIGNEELSTQLIEHFSIHPEYGYDLIQNSIGQYAGGYTEEELHSELLKKKPDEIFVCFKQQSDQLINHLISFGIKYRVKVKVVSELVLTKKYAQIIKYYSLPILQMQANTNRGINVRVFKRGFDIIFSSSILIAGFPIFFTLYLITRLSSNGPAYYRQERIGLNNMPFQIYKFRSMFVDAEKFGPQLSKDNDPRITKWGKVMRKTRLDELPQFWNVLKGDMSIVGPRPERRYFIDKIANHNPQYNLLLTIKPGITSIGQVHYGYAENVEQMCERLEYDLLYMENVSLNSDVKLIFNTVKVMLQGKGI